MAESYDYEGYEDDYEDDYEDESEVSEEEMLAWLDHEVTAFERRLGRELTNPEIESVARGALAQAEAGHEVDLQRPYDDYWAGRQAPDPSTEEGRVGLLSEYIQDARAEQESGEGDEDEGE